MTTLEDRKRNFTVNENYLYEILAERVINRFYKSMDSYHEAQERLAWIAEFILTVGALMPKDKKDIK